MINTLISIMIILEKKYEQMRKKKTKGEITKFIPIKILPPKNYPIRKLSMGFFS